MSNINKEFINSDKHSDDGYSSGGTKKTKMKSKKANLNPSSKKSAYKKMSDDEINDYLKDSILIPPEDWEKLAVGSNISYYKKDGNFIKSGFIKTIYIKDNNIFILYGTKLNSYSNDKYYKEFTVNASNIKELYKRIDASAILEYKIIKQNILNSMNVFIEKFKLIENEINTINEKISKLEINHTKTISFIKKLHNIKSIDDVKHIT